MENCVLLRRFVDTRAIARSSLMVVTDGQPVFTWLENVNAVSIFCLMPIGILCSMRVQSCECLTWRNGMPKRLQRSGLHLGACMFPRRLWWFSRKPLNKPVLQISVLVLLLDECTSSLPTSILTVTRFVVPNVIMNWSSAVDVDVL